MHISEHKMMAHAGRILGDHRPITADIFLTNFCNNRCPYCTYNRWERDAGARYMKYDDFVRCAERLKELGVEGFILTGGGEPSIDPDFDKIAAWLSDNGYRWGINTNFNVLKMIRPSYLKVSLDGYSEASYEKRRGIRNYLTVRRNIIEYSQWRRVNSPDTTLGIQMVATNSLDVYRFYEANKDLDVDYIVFRPVESTGGKYYYGAHRITDPYDPESVHSIIKAIDDLRSRDSRVIRNFKWDMLDMQEPSCVAQWAQIAINEAGSVMYCCHKPYQILGHVMDDNILEMKARAHTEMKKCDIPCRMTAPNAFVSQINRKRDDDCFI